MKQRVVSVTLPKARKHTNCEECGCGISKGETYVYKVLSIEGNKGLTPHRSHLICPKTTFLGRFYRLFLRSLEGLARCISYGCRTNEDYNNKNKLK